MVTPYLVRAETRSVSEVGRRAGEVGAAATAGSIAGTFGTGFVLLPLMPLPLLLGITAAGLVGLSALAGLVLGRGPAARDLGIVALAVFLVGAFAGVTPPSVLADEQTVYTSIVVREGLWTDGEPVLEMRQSGASSSVEYVASGEPAHPYATMSLRWMDLLAREHTAPSRVLVVGGAALTLPLAIARRFPDARVDVVEIDPRATELAYEHFAVGRDPAAERIEVVHMAGRHFLETTDRPYDLIYIDAFDHLVTVPWTLVTREAFATAASRLRPRGTIAANVLAPLAGPGDAFLARLLATAESEFPAVRGYRVTPGEEPTVVQNVLLVMAPDGSFLPTPGWPETPVEAAGRPLTDDWAPIDALQAQVFWGGLEW